MRFAKPCVPERERSISARLPSSGTLRPNAPLELGGAYRGTRICELIQVNNPATPNPFVQLKPYQLLKQYLRNSLLHPSSLVSSARCHWNLFAPQNNSNLVPCRKHQRWISIQMTRFSEPSQRAILWTSELLEYAILFRRH